MQSNTVDEGHGGGNTEFEGPSNAPSGEGPSNATVDEGTSNHGGKRKRGTSANQTAQAPKKTRKTAPKKTAIKK